MWWSKRWRSSASPYMTVNKLLHFRKRVQPRSKVLFSVLSPAPGLIYRDLGKRGGTGVRAFGMERRGRWAGLPAAVRRLGSLLTARRRGPAPQRLVAMSANPRLPRGGAFTIKIEEFLQLLLLQRFADAAFYELGRHSMRLGWSGRHSVSAAHAAMVSKQRRSSEIRRGYVATDRPDWCVRQVIPHSRVGWASTCQSWPRRLKLTLALRGIRLRQRICWTRALRLRRNCFTSFRASCGASGVGEGVGRRREAGLPKVRPPPAPPLYFPERAARVLSGCCFWSISVELTGSVERNRTSPKAP